MTRAFLGRPFLRVLYPKTRGSKLRVGLGLVMLLVAATTHAEQPDDPTLCGGKAIPGSHAWVEPPRLEHGVLFISAGWVISAPPREDRLTWFCDRGRAATTGWDGEARKEFCL